VSTTIVPEAAANPWVGRAPASPAGPAPEGVRLHVPPAVRMPPRLQTLRFSVRQLQFVFRARRELGEVFSTKSRDREEVVITSHPDHVRSLFAAKPELAPSITGESPLRPIVGESSVLTSVGTRHMRQRKLLLPPFHGEAVARYVGMISDAVEREIDRWPIGEPFELAPRTRAITLDVIMGGVFGIEGRPAKGTPEDLLRRRIRQLIWISTMAVAQAAELMNIGKTEPVGLTKAALSILDRATFPVIAARREREDLAGRTDILSLLLQARAEDGKPLTDRELRDELLTLVLAGHETTANSLAWTFERLLRTPHAYDRLREEVRGADQAASEAYVEATINETMRSRPVIPIIGRRVTVPWQLGEFGVAADTPVLMSILLLHHREDLYPDPYTFRPERFLDHKPGTYEWIPFGGGIRRCLGAALAMAEQRVVLNAIIKRTDLVAEDLRPETAVHRNVTMIPSGRATVVVREKR
jgi:cytochrome P450